MTTTTHIATWGNSEAVRIPRRLLAQAGLKSGDAVVLSATATGTIELSRPAPTDEHRHVKPHEFPTFDELFASYSAGRLQESDPWHDLDATETEKGVWDY